MPTIYVNTDAVSGGDGTSGSPYDTWDNLETGEASESYSADVIVLLEGQTLDTSFGSKVLEASVWTGIGSNKLILRGNPDSDTGKHPGYWSTSHYRIESDNTEYVIRNRDIDVVFDGIQIHNTDDTSSTANCIYSSSIINTEINACIINCASNANGVYINATLAVPIQIRNSVFFHPDNSLTSQEGIQLAGGNHIVEVSNNVFYNIDDGIENDGSSGAVITVTNNAFPDCGVGIDVTSNPTTFTIDYNAFNTDDSGGTGTNSVLVSSVEWSGVFVDIISADFHLQDGTDLELEGTNLTSAFSVDIDGDTRPNVGAWNIGVDSFSATGESLVPTSIDTSESFGIPTFIWIGDVSPTSIDSSEAFGTPNIDHNENAITRGNVGYIPFSAFDEFDDSYVGSLTGLSLLYTVFNQSGIPEIFDPNNLSIVILEDRLNIYFTDTDSITDKAFGNVRVRANEIQDVIVPIEFYGVVAIDIEPTSINSSEAFDNPELILGNINIIPVSINSSEVFGSPEIIGGDINIEPTSIDSNEDFGSPDIINNLQIIELTSISSSEGFGIPEIINNLQIIEPTSIDSNEDFGSPDIINNLQIIELTSINSSEAFGIPEITIGSDINIEPISINSSEAFGIPEIVYYNEITTNFVYNEFFVAMATSNINVSADDIIITLHDSNYRPRVTDTFININISSELETGSGYVSGGLQLSGANMVSSEFSILQNPQWLVRNSALVANWGVIWDASTLPYTPIYCTTLGNTTSADVGSYFKIEYDDNILFTIG